MDRFSGKVALVSGGAGAIGSAIASRLAGEGATVATCDLRGADVECDVTSMDSCHAAVMSVVDGHGGLDILVNAAGIGRAFPITNFPIEDWRRIIDVNLTGAFALSTAALPPLLDRRGCIVNLASVSALRGSPYNAAYAASKAALISLTKTMAVELAARGVRVNAVAPSSVATPFLAGFAMPEDADMELVRRASPPMGVVLQPDEVATAVAYLCSGDAASMTGSVLVIDGGASA